MSKLKEWITAMAELTPNPKVGEYYVLKDTIYTREILPKTGKEVWHRLTHLEAIELWLSQGGRGSPRTWLNTLNRVIPQPRSKQTKHICVDE